MNNESRYSKTVSQSTIYKEGIHFILYRTSGKKTTANSIAKILRNKGYYVRVLKSPKGYEIWVSKNPRWFYELFG